MVNRQETRRGAVGRAIARLGPKPGTALVRLPSPKLASRRALLAAAGLVTAVIWVALIVGRGHITAALGDTDDAMRLILVRQLLAGQGWWDQLVTRLQPPLGSYMQWSQLLTGVLAGATWLVSRVSSPAFAEWAVRLCWPMALILPCVAACLTAARRLSTPSALLPAAILLLITPDLYLQFVPGRIDHHNVQITLAVAAFAAALAPTMKTRAAILAGLFSGLGLAIGLEAMFFHALVGVSFALRLAADREEASTAKAYGLALLASTVGFFAVQTPPWRWPLSFCDSLGLNVVLAASLAGGGLAIAGALARRLSTAARLGLVLVVGVAAASAWLAADPSCLHGPFVAVDPRVRPFWFDRIFEIQPWWKTIASDRDATVGEMIFAAISLAAASFLVVRQWRRPSAGALLALAMVVVAVATNAEARRMHFYVAWFGVPVIAAAVTLIARDRLRGLLLPMLVVTLFAAPVNVAFAVNAAVDVMKGKKPGGVPAAAVSCFDLANFAPLARLPPGIVLSETDLGPFILATTRDSVLAAPYHRMSWGILAAHSVLDAPPGRAEAMTRRLEVSYIVDCPSYPMNVSPAGFGSGLRRQVPAWLEVVSGPRDRLRIYRVRPL